MSIQKLKLYLKVGLLISSLIILFSCKTDDRIFEIDAQSEQKTLNITLAHWHEFELGYRKIANNVGKFRQKNQKLRTVHESQDGFFIDETQVQIIENEYYTTYTFVAKRPEQQNGILENYMFKEFADGTYKQFLLTYYYTIDSFGNQIFDTNEMGVQLIDDEGIILNRSQNRTGECHPHFDQVEDGMTCTYNERCTGNNAHEVGDDCPCNGSNGCYPPQSMVCEQNYIYIFDDCSGSPGTGDTNNPNNPSNPPIGGGNTGSGSNTNNTGNTNSTPLGYDIRLGQFTNTLNSEQLAWWNDSGNHFQTLMIHNFLSLNDYSDRAKIWAYGQIDLEILAGQYNWSPSSGEIAGQRYIAVDHRGSIGSYFKMTDDSIIFASSEEQTLTEAGDLTPKFRDLVNFDPNERFYYILEPGQMWAELLFDPDNLADALATLFVMAGQDLGEFLGRYVFPIEDLKILIDGTDFDGEQVSRWQAAGFLLLSVVPGGRLLRIVDDAVDIVKVVIKLNGGTHVIDLVATGLRVAQDAGNGTIRLLNQLGVEVARIVNGIMTVIYDGFGGNIITTANKTTTIIGKWVDQIEHIWNAGLAKQGENIGGLNILGDVTGNVDEVWAINKPWLDEAIARGDIIRVTADPSLVDNVVFNNNLGIDFNSFDDVINYMSSFVEGSQNWNHLTFYGKEIHRLLDNGYIFDPITKTFGL